VPATRDLAAHYLGPVGSRGECPEPEARLLCDGLVHAGLILYTMYRADGLQVVP
jgi:hypothetical protein